MKITRAYIDEPKPKWCDGCIYYWCDAEDMTDRCIIGAEDYAHCPLVYAPSKSVMRRLDIQLDRGEE